MAEIMEIRSDELSDYIEVLSRLFDDVRICPVASDIPGGRNVRVELGGEGHRVTISTPLRLKGGDRDGELLFLECLAVPGPSAEDAKARQRLYTDALTGCSNRLCFEEQGFVTEKGCPVSFIMTDIRDFKTINDTYGHPTGDVALQKTVAVMKRHIRATDAVIRMGGDEFLIVLYHCGLEDARRAAEKIRENLRTQAIFDEERGLSVYINIGIDSREDFDGSEATCRAMYAEADRLMYVEKRS